MRMLGGGKGVVAFLAGRAAGHFLAINCLKPRYEPCWLKTIMEPTRPRTRRSPFSIGKQHAGLARAVGLVILAAPLAAVGVVFTNDTVIPFGDLTYDGQDLVIGNCTVTVDGPHTFANVLVAPGGILTHSPASSGYVTNRISVTNEAHTLESTNAVALLLPNVHAATIKVTDDSQSVTYVRDTDYWVSDLGNGQTGLHHAPDSAIPDGATVRVSYDADQVTAYAGLDLVVSGHVAVATGGAILANGKGYAGGAGPGLGLTAGTPQGGSGAGHGSFGGMSSSNAPGGSYYGSTENPSLLGSGGGAGTGGAGGAGGGAIKLTVGGNLTLHGVIAANGANAVNSRSGGGSGGSIWITADNITGHGAISANGGNGEPIHGGGGAGGRIAVYFDTNLFTGTITAVGGTGFQNGAAGTIFTKTNSVSTAQVIVDNGGLRGTNTVLTTDAGIVDLTLQGGAQAGGISGFRHLTIRANSALALSGMSQTVTVWGDARIEPGGVISMDGLGYGYGQGPGAGRYVCTGSPAICSGGGGGNAGYGGNGAFGGVNSAGGNASGSLPAPGSGGGGGSTTYPGAAGGGALTLRVNGTLQLDGRISADGASAFLNGFGGGAGGSLRLTLNRWTGNGVLSANGGAGDLPNGGGGGGGFIDVTWMSNAFTGTITARWRGLRRGWCRCNRPEFTQQ